MVVVDNGSSKESLEKITDRFHSATFIQNKSNLGYAAGVNVGLRYAQGQDADYVLLLNNDTLIEQDMLTRLVECAQQYGAAAVAPVICYEESPEIIWSAGAYRQTLTQDIRGNKRGEQYQNAEPYLVDYATACGLLIQGKALRDVGLFDEQFFMYYEDLDWCWRLMAQNGQILVVPQARMWHKVAATIGGSDSAQERYYMALSSVLFFRKYTDSWHWLIVVPTRLVSALKTSWRLFSKQRSKQAFRAYWRGIWHGLRA